MKEFHKGKENLHGIKEAWANYKSLNSLKFAELKKSKKQIKKAETEIKKAEQNLNPEIAENDEIKISPQEDIFIKDENSSSENPEIKIDEQTINESTIKDIPVDVHGEHEVMAQAIHDGEEMIISALMKRMTGTDFKFGEIRKQMLNNHGTRLLDKYDKDGKMIYGSEIGYAVAQLSIVSELMIIWTDYKKRQEGVQNAEIPATSN